MATAKTRPVRESEVQGRINAFKGARLALTQNKSIREAALISGTPPGSISSAINVITHGTPEEIEGCESGRLQLEPTSDAVRARTPKGERDKKRRAPTQTALVKQAREIDADVWGKLRDALDAITGLPSAKDTAVIVRKNNMRIEHVNRKLLAALSWIQEFSDEVTS